MGNVARKIDGMDCAEEVATLRAALGPVNGVRELSFDTLGRRMDVTFDESRLKPGHLAPRSAALV